MAMFSHIGLVIGLVMNEKEVTSDVDQGRIWGGLEAWGSGPPPPFWETPKLHKEGEKVACVHGKTPRFST